MSDFDRHADEALRIVADEPAVHRVTRLNTDDPVDEECDCEIGEDHG